MNQDNVETKKFVDYLVTLWNSISRDASEAERIENLNDKVLLNLVERESASYSQLNKYGEYSIKFLILLARLLIKQEKNNRNDAYMFSNLLRDLRNYKSIYKIISTATMSGRK